MSQDIVLHLGVAADGIGLSVAGPRAGPATAFLDAQTGGSVSDGGKAVESGGTTFSPIVAGGSLMAHENAGGHMLERHAGQGKSDLSTRLKAEPKITSVSSFYDRKTADSAISEALNLNKKQIADWLSSPLSRLRIDYTGRNSSGISIVRGASEAADVKSTRIILVRDPSLPTGYRIQTGFSIQP